MHAPPSPPPHMPRPTCGARCSHARTAAWRAGSAETSMWDTASSSPTSCRRRPASGGPSGSRQRSRRRAAAGGRGRRAREAGSQPKASRRWPPSTTSCSAACTASSTSTRARMDASAAAARGGGREGGAGPRCSCATRRGPMAEGPHALSGRHDPSRARSAGTRRMGCQRGRKSPSLRMKSSPTGSQQCAHGGQRHMRYPLRRPLSRAKDASNERGGTLRDVTSTLEK